MRAVGIAAVMFAAGTAGGVEIKTAGRPVQLAVTSTTVGSWNANNGNATSCDDDFAVGLERFNVNGSWEEWVLGLRLDGTLYAPRPAVRPGLGSINPCGAFELTSRYRDSVVPEKVWAGWMGRTVEVTVGDSYVSFGRGLSLSLRKSDELGLDTTQRGVRVNLHTERVTGTLVGGVTNINNLDEPSGRWADDPLDAVLGLTGDVRLGEGVRLGAHAVGVAYRSPVSTFAPQGVDQSYQERWLIGGPKVDAPRLTSWLGMYLEGVAQQRMLADGTQQSGFGAYGTATATAGPMSLLLEGKAYGDLAVVQPRFDSLEFRTVQYTALPTLERVQQQIEHPQRNITGGRVRADWSVRPELNLFVNYGFFRDFEGYLEPATAQVLPGSISDPYVGVDARLGTTRIHGLAGVRRVMVKGVAVHDDRHLDLNILHGLPGGSSLEFHVMHWERSKELPFGGEAWREGFVQLGYRKRPQFGLGAIVDYTTQLGQPSLWYPGATAEWNFTDSSNVRLFAGSSRGGLRCISGVCRIFPPFSGVKASLTLRY